MYRPVQITPTSESNSQLSSFDFNQQDVMAEIVLAL